MGHANDIDHAANRSMLLRRRKDALDIASFRNVAGESYAVDFAGDAGRARVVTIDANDLGAGLGQRVARLPADAVATPEHDHDATCKTV
jgi:hypothetical protein